MSKHDHNRSISVTFSPRMRFCRVYVTSDIDNILRDTLTITMVSNLSIGWEIFIFFSLNFVNFCKIFPLGFGSVELRWRKEIVPSFIFKKITKFLHKTLAQFRRSQIYFGYGSQKSMFSSLHSIITPTKTNATSTVTHSHIPWTWSWLLLSFT